MFLLDDTIVYSASDLATAAECEFGLLRRLDAKLGRIELEVSRDVMLERAATLGDVHEHRVQSRFEQAHGTYTPGTSGGVADIAVPERYDRAHLEAATERTLEALRDGADVVVQGSFFDGRFHGRSDFLIKQGTAYAVYDTKLARHAKITALLQLAAYAHQLELLGIPVDPQVCLLLGDYDPDVDPERGRSLHDVGDILPVYLDRRARLERIIDEHHGEPGAVAWGDPRYSACGRCDVCAAEVAEHRDVLLVAGLRMTQRAHLHAAGIETIEALAESTGAIQGIPKATLDRLRSQAQLQVAQDQRPLLPNGQPDVEAVIVDLTALRSLPPSDLGDIYFDFEGDPLWSDDDRSQQGLEYLFGVMESDTGEFVGFWAHDRSEEKQALRDFLDYLAARRAAYPGMHVYHYAAYERTALLRLAGRYGEGEDEVDDLLREQVLVDLYSTVRASLRVSQPSYSLKKLEPLYMGDELRSGDVTNAADSVTAYAEACAKRDVGDQAGWEHDLAEIEDYNRYDCLSTLKLDGYLRGRAGEHGVTWGDAPEGDADEEPERPRREPDPLGPLLLAPIADIAPGERSADERAIAMLAASLEYHRREDKPFWWAHFERLQAPVDEWAETRDVFVVESGEVVEDWHVPPRARTEQRVLRLVGDWGPGSTARSGDAFLLYDPPLPSGVEPPVGLLRAAINATLLSREEEDGKEVVLVRERVPTDVPTYDALPMALTPGGGPRTTNLELAIHAVADLVHTAGLVEQPGLDVLRRVPPRTLSGSLPEIAEGGDAVIDAITDAVTDLDRSYVAVQGPPGTGKTYVGARVVRRLVERGWRVGVVAQSHAVVEHFLDAVVEAGLDGARVGKDAKGDARRWTDLSSADKLAGFLDAHADGCLVGGTAWDITTAKRIERGVLDLLVIDEAGQFALANTIAVSVAAQRLLLLGDPQQLPQVSQGVHPEPVDGSALGWLADGHPTLPSERGYFLERSWRMHSALCSRVSTLSYADRLHSHVEATDARALQGVEPGVHVIDVSHEGNAVESVEEADEVVRQVQALIGRTWTDPRAKPKKRPLSQADILVVAPYNAQVACLKDALESESLGDVAVGTVDKFQGQEAPVVIVSMTASSAADVPRGMDFLLSRNRVNVAVSRAQCAAYVVRSPRLTDYLPGTPEGLAELGAFLRLTT